MPKSIKKENRKGSLVYTSAVFFLLSGLSFFIPFCSYQDEYGVTAGLTSYKILIGGEDTFYLNSYLYSFSYKLNIPLLLMLQLCLLSIVASIFGKRDKTNLIIATILGAITFILNCFSLPLATLSSSLLMNGIRPGVGYFFSLGFCFIALVNLLICLFPIIFKKKQKDYEL